MKHALIICALLCASPASAACYADYKAKQDSPLKLDYGVVRLSDNQCNMSDAKRVVDRVLGNTGWTLLGVQSVFDDAGLAERKKSAGENILRN